MSQKKRISQLVATTSGYQKLLIAAAAALMVSAGSLLINISTITRIILAWDTFAVCMISMMLILFFTTTSNDLKRIVTRQDDSISTIFTIVVTAVCISFTCALLLIFNADMPYKDKDLRTVATLVAISTSWVLLHTIFTVRYAHLYHDNSITKKADNEGGLDFPDDTPPDYIDFAYFSFVIGMTFQVSDVTISSKTIRRYALLHSLISFVFNTVIVALTVNIIAGLKNH